MIMHLAIQELSLYSLAILALVHSHANETKETNISNKRDIVQTPYWKEADQLAIYKV